MVQHALEQLKELLGESSPFQGRLPNSISFKDLQQKLEEVQTAAQLCEEVLGIEGAVSLLGSGPRGDYHSPDVHNKPNNKPNNNCNDTTITILIIITITMMMMTTTIITIIIIIIIVIIIIVIIMTTIITIIIITIIIITIIISLSGWN